jgi:NAD(P)-dependent dehydrogenase (short-subunit alcohol dehydrogenase family)
MPPATAGLRTYEGAVAVLTGGASGIGAAMGAVLCRAGATVILADRQGDVALEAAGRLRAAGGRAEAAACDVRDAAAVEALVESAFARHGRLDYLFNNAGIATGGEVLEHTLDDWRYIIDVNLLGVVHGVHAAYPRMVRQGFGHIVNTASTAGLVPTPGTTPYGTTKHAVVGLSRSLRAEARPHRVRVSVLCPGAIQTPILLGGGRFGRMARPVPEAVQREFWAHFRPMGVDDFAARALRQVADDRAVIVVPAFWRVAIWLDRLFPALMELLIDDGYRRAKARFEAASKGEAAGSGAAQG